MPAVPVPAGPSSSCEAAAPVSPVIARAELWRRVHSATSQRARPCPAPPLAHSAIQSASSSGATMPLNREAGGTWATTRRSSQTEREAAAPSDGVAERGLSARALRARFHGASPAPYLRSALARLVCGRPSGWGRRGAGDAPWRLPQGAGAQPPFRHPALPASLPDHFARPAQSTPSGLTPPPSRPVPHDPRLRPGRKVSVQQLGQSHPSIAVQRRATSSHRARRQ